MANISEEKWIEILEKKADGSYIAKYPKVKSKSGITFDEHLADDVASKTEYGHVQIGTGLAVDKGVISIPIKANASDTVVAASLEEVLPPTSFTVTKQVEVFISGTMRVTFDLRRRSGSGMVVAQVKGTGVSGGTDATTSSTSYVSFTRDVEVVAGSKIILLTYGEGGTGYPAIRNFRLCFSVGIDLPSEEIIGEVI